MVIERGRKEEAGAGRVVRRGGECGHREAERWKRIRDSKYNK